MLTRWFKEKTVGGGAGLARPPGGSHLPMSLKGDLKPGFSLREKLSYFSEVFFVFFFSFCLRTSRSGPLSVPELLRLKDLAGGRDLRVPNPQRRVRFKGTVI